MTTPLVPTPLQKVMVDGLGNDTQVLRANEFSLTQAWWIQLEFWQVPLGW